MDDNSTNNSGNSTNTNAENVTLGEVADLLNSGIKRNDLAKQLGVGRDKLKPAINSAGFYQDNRGKCYFKSDTEEEAQMRKRLLSEFFPPDGRRKENIEKA